jgi:hypothetical protein
MTEQLESWSSRYEIPREDFFIAGLGSDYEPAVEAYTNKETPFILNKDVRFIFTSQANIQRNNHLSFRLHTYEPISYGHILIDEFDFKLGVIPSLDYEISNMRQDSIRKKTENQKLKWIEQNYTFDDRIQATIALKKHTSGFSLAHWIKTCSCPITFLSSEILATRFLKLLGFEDQFIGEKEFKDCRVNFWSDKKINRNWFNLMNQNIVWDQLAQKYNYDLVISDSILPFYEEGTSSLEVKVLSHMGVRGSNSHRDKAILTVLSYIPKQAIKEIQDAFNYFGDDISYEEVESLFYRDRLCQSVGRVLGYRGGSEADVICHSDLLDKLDWPSFPYSINSWQPETPQFQEVLDKVEDEALIKKLSKIKPTNIDSYSFLEEFFTKDITYSISVSSLKTFLEKNHLKTYSGNSIPATKIAKYFNGIIKNKNIRGKQVRYLFGVRPK